MILLHFRYNNNEVPACLPTALMSITQVPLICTYDNIGRYLGRHPRNEWDRDENCELTNAMALLVLTGHIAGTPGHYQNRGEQIQHGLRVIDCEESVFRLFEAVENESNGRQDFVNMIDDNVLFSNTWLLLMVTVTMYDNNGGVVDTSPHWAHMSKLPGGDDWWGGHGIRGSNIFMIKCENLADLLFTKAGRETLCSHMGTEFMGSTGYFTEVVPAEKSFIAMPKIQLTGTRQWEEEIEAGVSDIEGDVSDAQDKVKKVRNKVEMLMTIVNNDKSKRREWHTCQVVDTENPAYPGLITHLDNRLSENMKEAEATHRKRGSEQANCVEVDNEKSKQKRAT